MPREYSSRKMKEIEGERQRFEKRLREKLHAPEDENAADVTREYAEAVDRRLDDVKEMTKSEPNATRRKKIRARGLATLHTDPLMDSQIIETAKEKRERGEDDLTGLPRRFMYEKHVAQLQKDAQKWRERAAMGGHAREADMKEKFREEPFSILMIDIDHFKTINDTYGHAAGDTVLRAVGQALQKRLRKGDTVARVGGEEFRVIALATNGNAARLGEALRRLIAEGLVDDKGRKIEIPVTISVGVAPYNENTELMEERSDKANYAAKGKKEARPEQYAKDTSNRNQVWVWDEESKECKRVSDIPALLAA